MLADAPIIDYHCFLLNFSLRRGLSVLEVIFIVPTLLYWNHKLKEEVFLMLVLVFKVH